MKDLKKWAILAAGLLALGYSGSVQGSGVEKPALECVTICAESTVAGSFRFVRNLINSKADD